jgi:hypothetical protein
MKNVHILPTDKPSRLAGSEYITNEQGIDKRAFKLKLWNKIISNKDLRDVGYIPQNIYITSDEEIKDVRPHKGKWQLEQEQILNKFPTYLTDLSECKLVIMTTDPDLIAEGVQSIDNEFLEWFVRNPSCEFVEVELHEVSFVVTDNIYKIIIPNLEIWKDIPEFEGYYQVSNLGNVKSLSRTILGKNDVPTLLKEKMLKFSTSTNGYYQVILCKNSDRKIFKVHSLVAICFLNHIPDGTHNVVIDHINEIKTDNRIENLRLIGHRENVSRSIKDSTSTYVGVSWSKNAKKWISQITIDGKTKYLGLFDNEQDANKKYLETLKDL